MKIRMSVTMLALCAVATGCGRHYEKHVVEDVQASAGGSLSETTMVVTLPEGAVLTATITPFDNDDDPMPNSEISTDAPDILEVMPVSGESETTYAFIGRRAGQTTVRYYAEGQEVRSERATVTARLNR